MSSILVTPKNYRAVPAALMLMVFGLACGGAPVVERSITEADLDALPVLTTTDGATLCRSGTFADTVCPMNSATANWLSAESYATWESGRPVQVWRAGQALTIQPLDTLDGSRYRIVTGVGPGSSGEIMLVDPIGGMEHRYSSDGKHLGATALAPMSMMSNWGYYGKFPIWSIMETSADRTTADFVVKLGKKIDDSSAKEVFRTNLPWLQLVDGSTRTAPPLFPNWVSYAFNSNGEAVWSNGAKFVVEKDRANGKPEWRVSGDFTGPAVDSFDIAWKVTQLTAPGTLVPADQLDSMKVKSVGTHHPAINGVVISPAGGILVVRSVLPKNDSIKYVRFTSEGVPIDQFSLLRTAQLVLFAGDSVLVHRSVDNEPKELVWLHLKGSK